MALQRVSSSLFGVSCRHKPGTPKSAIAPGAAQPNAIDIRSGNPTKLLKARGIAPTIVVRLIMMNGWVNENEPNSMSGTANTKIDSDIEIGTS